MGVILFVKINMCIPMYMQPYYRVIIYSLRIASFTNLYNHKLSFAMYLHGHSNIVYI